MPGNIYVPVMDAQMRQIVTSWNAGRTAQRKIPYAVVEGTDHGWRKGLRHTVGLGLLRQIPPGEKLYILQHGLQAQGSHMAIKVGATRGGTVSAGLQGPVITGGTQKGYSPDELAEHLEKEGLVKSFRDLRLFCCGSGVSEASKTGQMMPSYAERFKQAMARRGYNALTVTGYLGDLTAARDKRLKPGAIEFDVDDVVGEGKGVYLPGDTYATLASNHRVQF